MATHIAPPHGGVADATYRVDLMEWHVVCRDGTRLRFYGDLERHNGAGWPLMHPRSRLDQTLALRPNEFKPA